VELWPPQEHFSDRRKENWPILVGLGANLPSPAGQPSETLIAALASMPKSGVNILQCSRFWRSAPWPPSDQPWFVNAVAVVDSALDPGGLMAVLHAVEAQFGRQRSVPNAARTLDLDLLAYGDVCRPGPDAPILPHPRLAERSFVLLPMRELVPDWRHPATGEGLEAMIARIPLESQAFV
jgi:2-amino-4-hydroxy-6-hydroxymethyldihydropteridine diphosphokinase